MAVGGWMKHTVCPPLKQRNGRSLKIEFPAVSRLEYEVVANGLVSVSSYIIVAKLDYPPRISSSPLKKHA